MDTQQRPCRLYRSISCVKWRWCPPLMSKWLYRLSLLSLAVQRVKQRVQVVNHMSPSDISHQDSASDSPIMVSWYALCPALHPQKHPNPRSLCKAERHCGRSEVLPLHVIKHLQLCFFYTGWLNIVFIYLFVCCHLAIIILQTKIVACFHC